jgi:hypothetical protein
MVSLLAPVLGTGRALAETEDPDEPAEPTPPSEPNDPPTGEDTTDGDAGDPEVTVLEVAPLDGGDACDVDFGIAKILVPDELSAEFGLLAKEKFARFLIVAKTSGMGDPTPALAGLGAIDVASIAPLDEHPVPPVLEPWDVDIRAVPSELEAPVPLTKVPGKVFLGVDSNDVQKSDLVEREVKEIEPGDPSGPFVTEYGLFLDAVLGELELERDDIAGQATVIFDGTEEPPVIGIEALEVRIPLTLPPELPENEAGEPYEDWYDALFGPDGAFKPKEVIPEPESDGGDPGTSETDPEPEVVPYPGKRVGTLVVRLEVIDIDDEFFDEIDDAFFDRESVEALLDDRVGTLDDGYPCVLAGVARFEKKRRGGGDSPVPTGIPSGEGTDPYPALAFALAVTAAGAVRVRRRLRERSTAA